MVPWRLESPLKAPQYGTIVRRVHRVESSVKASNTFSRQHLIKRIGTCVSRKFFNVTVCFETNFYWSHARPNLN
jgi:hypothetical protein